MSAIQPNPQLVQHIAAGHRITREHQVDEEATMPTHGTSRVYDNIYGVEDPKRTASTPDNSPTSVPQPNARGAAEQRSECPRVCRAQIKAEIAVLGFTMASEDYSALPEIGVLEFYSSLSDQ